MRLFAKQTLRNVVAIAAICSTTITIAASTYSTVSAQSIEQSTSETKQIKPSFMVAQASGVTGAWNCNDGGVYFIRQVGNQIWWYGESSDGGKRWSNVFQGTITGNKIIGRWADVPKGGIRGYGEMTLGISHGRLQKISGGENFGGSIWSRH
ncbi:hypothetical protein CAL7716_105150 (plasmid) [Calothrix sp. PCC 7716]|nr:hypothetical protein CAL7716_105150 [Calothrix sp. PCC 7716]